MNQGRQNHYTGTFSLWQRVNGKTGKMTERIFHLVLLGTVCIGPPDRTAVRGAAIRT